MRYLFIVTVVAMLAAPLMAADICKVCFSEDFEAYPINQRLKDCAPVWGYGDGPENKITLDLQGDKACRLKGDAGQGWRWSEALKKTNFVACMGGPGVQIFQFTLQHDPAHQSDEGNHLYVEWNETSGASLAYWYGYSKAITPRHKGTIGPSVNIRDGAVHNFEIAYDAATGLCEWSHNGALQWAKVIDPGHVTERVYVADLSRCGKNKCQDWVWLDDILVGKAAVQIALDILPNDDPNELTQNVRSKGRLPMAILGSAALDVSLIDPDSIAIVGADTVGPLKAPSICDESSDGIDDLVIHVSRRDLILALGLLDLDPGTVVDITVVGVLLDGTCFEATDSVTLVARSD